MPGSTKRTQCFEDALYSSSSALKKIVSTLRNDAETCRNNARTCITLRTAARIIEEQMTGDIKMFYSQCRASGYNVPKVIKAKLDAMQ